MAVLSLLLLVACPGTPPTYTGTKITPDYFPMDGDLWSYINQDPSIDWVMNAEKVEPVETLEDGTEVWTWEYSVEEGDLLARVKWSSKGGEALRIHAWSEGTGDFVVFDPPIALTPDDGYMLRDESVTTETGGYTFTSTLVGQETCDTQWYPEGNWECAHFILDDGDGDDMAGPFFAGEYWLVPRYGIAWMKITGYAEKWDLADYDAEETE